MRFPDVCLLEPPLRLVRDDIVGPVLKHVVIANPGATKLEAVLGVAQGRHLPLFLDQPAQTATGSHRRLTPISSM